MKLETIKKVAEKLGLETRIANMDTGATLFISLEQTEYTEAGHAWRTSPIARETELQLEKYLKRYNVKSEYSGNYTSLLIKEGV